MVRDGCSEDGGDTHHVMPFALAVLQGASSSSALAIAGGGSGSESTSSGLVVLQHDALSDVWPAVSLHDYEHDDGDDVVVGIESSTAARVLSAAVVDALGGVGVVTGVDHDDHAAAVMRLAPSVLVSAVKLSLFMIAHTSFGSACVKQCSEILRFTFASTLADGQNDDLLTPFHDVIARARTNVVAQRKIAWMCHSMLKFDHCMKPCGDSDAKRLHMVAVDQWAQICATMRASSKHFIDYIGCERRHHERAISSCRTPRVVASTTLAAFCRDLEIYTTCYVKVPFRCKSRNATDIWLTVGNALRQSYERIVTLAADRLELPVECEASMRAMHEQKRIADDAAMAAIAEEERRRQRPTFNDRKIGDGSGSPTTTPSSDLPFFASPHRQHARPSVESLPARVVDDAGARPRTGDGGGGRADDDVVALHNEHRHRHHHIDDPSTSTLATTVPFYTTAIWSSTEIAFSSSATIMTQTSTSTPPTQWPLNVSPLPTAVTFESQTPSKARYPFFTARPQSPQATSGHCRLVVVSLSTLITLLTASLISAIVHSNT